MENSEIIERLTAISAQLEEKAAASWDRYAIPTSFTLATSAAKLIREYQTNDKDVKAISKNVVENIMALEHILKDYSDPSKGFDMDKFENRSIRHNAIANPALVQIERFLSCLRSEQN